MASLTLTIGSLTATVSADNQKAAAILTQYAEAIGATGTNQEKADAVVRQLALHLKEVAQRHRSNKGVTDAMAALQVELDGLTWE